MLSNNMQVELIRRNTKMLEKDMIMCLFMN